MKRTIMILLATIVLTAGIAGAEALTTGQAASAWSFPDADGQMFTMDSWAGKVLMVNYVDPDEADMNEHFTEALKAAGDKDILRKETYKGIGIADCASTWKPNFLIRAIAGRKAKKYNTVILFDTEATLRNQWGLTADAGNIIILDKNRVCRAIVRGRVPDDQVEELVNLVASLQGE